MVNVHNSLSRLFSLRISSWSQSCFLLLLLSFSLFLLLQLLLQLFLSFYRFLVFVQPCFISQTLSFHAIFFVPRPIHVTLLYNPFYFMTFLNFALRSLPCLWISFRNSLPGILFVLSFIEYSSFNLFRIVFSWS